MRGSDGSRQAQEGGGEPTEGKALVGQRWQGLHWLRQEPEASGRKNNPSHRHFLPLLPLAESEARGPSTMAPPHSLPLVLGDPPPSFFWGSVHLVTHEWASYVHPASQKLL